MSAQLVRCWLRIMSGWWDQGEGLRQTIIDYLICIKCRAKSMHGRVLLLIWFKLMQLIGRNCVVIGNKIVNKIHLCKMVNLFCLSCNIIIEFDILIPIASIFIFEKYFYLYSCLLMCLLFYLLVYSSPFVNHEFLNIRLSLINKSIFVLYKQHQ